MFLRTLGGLTLEGAEFSRPKPLLLLSYLAIQGPVERRYLAELFWMGAANPRRSLATALSQIRASAPRAVTSDEVRVWTTVPCDCLRLLHAEGASRSDEREIYPGPFLQGFDTSGLGVELEEWVYSTREMLAARARRLLLELAGRQVRQAGARGFEIAAIHAERAYRIADGDEPDLESLLAIHEFLTAVRHPLASEVGEQAEALGSTLDRSPQSVRDSLLERFRAGREVRHLPRFSTSFVGRREEIRRLVGLLEKDEARLITITGPGGSGKTRLVTACVEHTGDTPICFVSLEAIKDPLEIPSAVAMALGVPLQGRDSNWQEVASSIGQGRLLLLLDNFEHLADGAPTLTELLTSCAGLKLLVTSREPLRLADEWVFPIAGLSLGSRELEDPPGPSGRSKSEARAAPALGSDAIALFRARARRFDPTFAIDDRNAEHALRLCRLLDGNPLAIELAATWVRVLSLSRICGEIERGLDLLTSRYGDAPVRQRSFRASLEHSWQLLGSGEKELLCRLTVFEGGFTLDAARSIAGAEPSSLVSLVDRSLLGVRLLPEQCERFELHALVRGYALEKREEWPGLAAELSEFHSRYYLARLASAADDLWGSDQTVTASQLALELANIRCAWVAASSSGNVEALRRAVEALWAVAEFIGALEPGAKLLREVRLLLVDRGLSTADAAYLEAVEGWFLVRLGRFADSEALARHALQVGRAADDRLVKIAALNTLAATAGSRGDLWRCRELYLEFFELVESSGDDRYLGVAFNNLAEVEAELGLYAEAECRYRQALTSARRQGNMRVVGQVLVNLAVALIWQVRSLEALPLALEALAISRLHDPALPSAQLAAGEAHLMLGELESARTLCDEAEEICLRSGLPSIAPRLLAARIAQRRGAAKEAEELLREAAQEAFRMDALPQLLEVTSYLAEVLDSRGKARDAMRLACIVASHPSTAHHVRRHAVGLRNWLGGQPEESNQAAGAAKIITVLDDGSFF